MAKAKPKKEAAVAPGDRVTILNLKGSRQYKEWLDRLAEFSHVPTSNLFDVAMADWAKRQGFPESPPKRQMR